MPADASDNTIERKRYNPAAIEPKWQKRWNETGLYKVPDTSAKPKYYALFEFPYPSGDGLHVGHLRPYTGMDVIARKRRMQGYNVLFPIGWDAFGLPAESYAVRTGVHPEDSTKKNIDTFRRQVKQMGYALDWDREVSTMDPKYYKWTQWIFLQLFKHELAYKARMPINWCPKDKIGLANEEVVAGCCERCGTPVERREKEQWMLKITAYAEKLLEGLENVDYLPQIKTQQVNWIGKSEGAELTFPLAGEAAAAESITVFTTRPDTLFGATYLVLAPEHSLIEQLQTSIKNWDVVQTYVAAAKKKDDIERSAETKEKTGVPLEGIQAINPVNKEKIPVWVADYVLPHYGTGAIMAVPAHDERDFAFAKQHGLPIVPVIEAGSDQPISAEISDEDRSPLAETLRKQGIGKEHVTPTFRRYEFPAGKATELFETLNAAGAVSAETADRDRLFGSGGFVLQLNTSKVEPLDIYTGSGTLVNSGKFTGLDSEEAKWKITKAVGGAKKIHYRLRDWIFSRQRYWGEPIPVVHCAKCGYVPLSESDLPLILPPLEDFKPRDDGRSPLASLTDWVRTTCPQCDGPAERETDVMPNWAGSSWYFLRYIDPRNDTVFADYEKLAYWMPVDWYNGGMEHVTLHLLYSRFWNQFLHDQKLVPVSEPYRKRTTHGLILAEGGGKMSKSLGNVVSPDELVPRYGADALRVYELFMGPFDQAIAWNPKGIEGAFRFLHRIWTIAHEKRIIASETAETKASPLYRLINQTVHQVNGDIEEMSFNTVVSALMIFVNEASKADVIPLEIWSTFLLLLAPLAPHIAEELWAELPSNEATDSIHEAAWPVADPDALTSDTVTLVIQVNGKVRDRVDVAADITEEEAKKIALGRERVQEFLAGAVPQRFIYVPGRLVNIVT